MSKSSRAPAVNRLKQRRLMWACGAKIATTLPNLSSIFTRSRVLSSVIVPHVDAAEQKHCPTCKRARAFMNLTRNMII